MSGLLCLQQEASLLLLLLLHVTPQPLVAAGPWPRTQPWTEPADRSPSHVARLPRFQLVVLWRRLVSQWRPEAPEQLRFGPGGPGGAAGGRPDGGVPATCPQTAEGTERHRPSVSASSSYPHGCMWRPPGGPAPRDPQKPFSQLLHFRPDQVKPSPLLPDQNRRGSLQSPSYAADHRFGPGFRERGPAGPAAGPGPAQEGRKRIRTPGLPDLDNRPAPPPEVYHHERLHQGAPPSSWVQSASATPSSKEALDFHRTPPLAFPSPVLCVTSL